MRARAPSARAARTPPPAALVPLGCAKGARAHSLGRADARACPQCASCPPAALVPRAAPGRFRFAVSAPGTAIRSLDEEPRCGAATAPPEAMMKSVTKFIMKAAFRLRNRNRPYSTRAPQHAGIASRGARGGFPAPPLLPFPYPSRRGGFARGARCLRARRPRARRLRACRPSRGHTPPRLPRDEGYGTREAIE